MLSVCVKYDEAIDTGTFRAVLLALRSHLPGIVAENLNHGGAALIPIGIEFEGVPWSGFTVLPANIILEFDIPVSLAGVGDPGECSERLTEAIDPVVPSDYSFLVKAKLVPVAWKERPASPTP